MPEYKQAKKMSYIDKSTLCFNNNKKQAEFSKFTVFISLKEKMTIFK